MRVLAVGGFIVLIALLGGYLFIRIKAPYLVEFTRGISERRVELELDSLENARFITGMTGPENLWLDPDGMKAMVTTLDGRIHCLDGPDYLSLEIQQTFIAGTSAHGITRVSDSAFAVILNSHGMDEWVNVGAALHLLELPEGGMHPISDDFPAANGVCTDNLGNLYFSSSNFSFLSPEGTIFFVQRGTDGSFAAPAPYFANAGLANGMFYDSHEDRIYFSNTMGGVYSFVPGEQEYREEFLKTRFMEACDDLCTDIAGNLWMTDPGYSTVKLFNPGTGVLTRFVIRGVGQTSSCRIRNEQGTEMIYITELKSKQAPVSKKFDGRGVLVIPARDLLRYIQP